MTNSIPKRGKRVPKVQPPNILETFCGTKQEQLNQLYDKWYGCTKCSLGELRTCNGAKDIVFGEGNPDADILIVGEAPGEEEDATGVPFVGKAGQLLNQILASTAAEQEVREAHAAYSKISHSEFNLKKIRAFHSYIEEWRDQYFFFTNAVACRPADNATPTSSQIKECWHRLWNIIYIIDPWLIIVCGNSALSALLRKVQTKITAVRGHIYDVEYPGRVIPITYPILPIFHPAYLLRKADWQIPDGDYAKTVKDVRTALKAVDFLKEHYLGIKSPNRE